MLKLRKLKYQYEIFFYQYQYEIFFYHFLLFPLQDKLELVHKLEVVYKLELVDMLVN